MASITEVARLAGVSVATASRVVSEADYPVSPATRERVLEAARTLDYVPNELARGMLGRRVPVVGVIVHDITDPYFAEVVRGVEDAAADSGYLVITCSSERDADRERSYVRLLRGMRAAAVVFAGSGLDDPVGNEEMDRHVEAMRAEGAAVVHLSPHARGGPDVGVDNAAGIASMIAALAGLGHRHIAFLAGPRALFVARERLDGYRRGLAEAGLPVDERLVVHTSFDREGGALGVDTLLAGEAPFTAVVCANDLLALGALARVGVDRERDRALGQQPLEVPAVGGLVELPVGVPGDHAGGDDPAQVEAHAMAPVGEVRAVGRGTAGGAPVEPRRTRSVGRRSGAMASPARALSAWRNPSRPSSRSGIRTVDSAGAVIAAIDSVIALKEASFDARLYLQTRRMIEGLERPIDLLTGDDNFIFESYVLGAEGALIGFGTLATDLQVELYGLTGEGRWEEARAIWERILPLEEVVYGQPVRDYRARTKVALRELGVIESTLMRPPLQAVGEADTLAVRAALEAAGLLPARVA